LPKVIKCALSPQSRSRLGAGVTHGWGL